MKRTPFQNKHSKAFFPRRIKKKSSLTSLKRQAVKVFNEYIRARDMIVLRGKCYTCDEPGNQAGHFIHNSNAHRFEEWAVRLQCPRCNLYLSGNLVAYTLRLIKDCGEEYVRELQSRKPRQISSKEYREIIEKYKAKLEDLST